MRRHNFVRLMDITTQQFSQDSAMLDTFFTFLHVRCQCRSSGIFRIVEHRSNFGLPTAEASLALVGIRKDTAQTTLICRDQARAHWLATWQMQATTQ